MEDVCYGEVKAGANDAVSVGWCLLTVLYGLVGVLLSGCESKHKLILDGAGVCLARFRTQNRVLYLMFFNHLRALQSQDVVKL